MGRAALKVTVRVLMIVGPQRAGSTLLATAVGMLPGAAVVGELRLLWQSLVEGRPCACLVKSIDCPIWSQVISEVMDTPSLRGVTLSQLAQLNEEVLRQRSLPAMLIGRVPKALEPLSVATRRLYPALARVHGVNVLADSSKSPAFFAYVRSLNIDGLDVVGTHLVRDVRGVVDSWSTTKSWARDGWSEELHSKPAGKAVTEWLAMNAGAQLARAKPRLRFEDVMNDPDRYLEQLARLLSLNAKPGDSDWPVQNGALLICENHAIGGNVDRFDTGPVALRTEEAWRTRLDPALRRRYAPLARRYGYLR